jgi:hypothetical protein
MLSALSPMLERALHRYPERATVHTSALPSAEAILGDALLPNDQVRFRTDYDVSISSATGLFVSGAVLVQTNDGDVALAGAHLLTDREVPGALWRESRRKPVETLGRTGAATVEELAQALSESFDDAVESIS